jgi:hypothetical protein
VQNANLQSGASLSVRAGDLNGDGGTSNDLIYIHRDVSEMNFRDCSVDTCDQGRYTFSRAEQENGRAAWLLGASFITEGAIPFAAADPLRVIPSIMAGSAVTGAMVMGIGNTLRAPHGGIWVIGLIGEPVLYLLAIVVGAAVTAACVIALKSLRRVPEAQPESVTVGA